jgi:uncharacterized protein (TIGR02246 family)
VRAIADEVVDLGSPFTHYLEDPPMNSRGLGLAAVIAVGTAVAVAGFGGRSQDRTTGPAGQPAKADGPEAGIKAITANYETAINAGDAKAAAALWTSEGEYVGYDGETLTGRAAIEKGLAEFLKEHPKAKSEVRIESVRSMGRGLASVEGVVRLKVPGDDPVIETRYTALHVLEDGKWYAASVKEWVPDPATEVTPQQLEWMLGDWSAKGNNGELKITYSWDETKTFITGKYTVAKDGKTITSGTQVIGRNPSGGLHSWTFDSSGTTSNGIWVRDEGHWLSEVSGVLPDGTEITSLNVVVKLGPDAFTFQTTDRATDGVPLPALPPVKVTRVKK